jgi:uroporphyrinogen decarboxylase
MNRPELTSRERVRLALEHRETDRVPIALICSGINEPARTAFDQLLRERHGIGADAYLDAILDVAYVAPPYVGPPLPAGTDIWGVIRKAVSYGPASYDEIARYPLAAASDPAEVERYPWPTAALFDYAALPERIRAIRRHRDRALIVANANVFESSWYLRGFEQFFLDLVTAPDIARAIMRHVTDFYLEHFRRILEVAGPGEIDLAFTADDIAGQNGLLMSLGMWEEHLKPFHVEINRLIHSFGTRVIYHSDGAVTAAVPGLIDMGIDVLQALQFDAAGMDPEDLKGRFGHRLSFEGGVSVQRTLPFGTPDEVREEVRRLINVLGRGGGYILGPSHAIQAGTPAENIIAMFETALNP